MKKRSKSTGKDLRNSTEKSSENTNEMEKPPLQMPVPSLPGLPLRKVQDLYQGYLERKKARGFKRLLQDARCSLGLHRFTAGCVRPVRGEVEGVGVIKKVFPVYCENCGLVEGRIA